VVFEKGYFIDNENNRKECFIKNTDTKRNPENLIYRNDSLGSDITLAIDDVSEFQVYGWPRYVRSTVDIDISTSAIDKMTINKEPQWEKRTVFLKVLVEGKAVLYFYDDDEISRYFFSTSDTAIQQLIYKKYLTPSGDNVKENTAFKQQLLNYVRCDKISQEQILATDYNVTDLTKYFKKYNECLGISYEKVQSKQGNKNFHLKVGMAAGISSVKLNQASTNRIYDFEKPFISGIGIEVSYILSFNRNKWEILINPNFQTFKSSIVSEGYVTNSEYKSEIQYSIINFPIGLRYYMFLSDNVKLSVSGCMIPPVSVKLNSNFRTDFINKTYECKPRTSFIFGGGIAYKKISAEIRYYTNNDFFMYMDDWTVDYRQVLLQLNYRLF
jgi:hypothetical protein